MIAWDTTDKDNPTPVVYCDGCGDECTETGVEIYGKNYCRKCLTIYTGYEMRRSGENEN